MKLDRKGFTYGGLTVLEDRGDHLHCACKCGREGRYPKEISKPSYRGPRQCPWCCGSPCEVCGELIPYFGKIRALTCSEECRKKRACDREKIRYQKIKDTQHFKNVRKAYLARIAILISEDKELYAKLSEQKKNAVRKWRAKMFSTLEGRKRYRAMKKKHDEKYWQQLTSNPELYSAKLQRHRDWYARLSEADYERIFVTPRNKKPNQDL